MMPIFLRRGTSLKNEQNDRTKTNLPECPDQILIDYDVIDYVYDKLIVWKETWVFEHSVTFVLHIKIIYGISREQKF